MLLNDFQSKIVSLGLPSLKAALEKKITVNILNAYHVPGKKLCEYIGNYMIIDIADTIHEWPSVMIFFLFNGY